MIGIVDYNAGNITSVERALKSLSVQYIRSKNPEDLKSCSKLIFPGVGEASYAMNQLKVTGLGDFLKGWAKDGKPLMGICLGSQIIFDYSEEGGVECLGLLKGTIQHFSKVWDKEGNSSSTLKIPQMGWNDLNYANGSSKLLQGVPEHSDFYFVHSYLIQPEDSSIIKAYVDYGTKVPACVEKDNIAAFQFHPEKSGELGLRILKNYCSGSEA